MPFSKNEVGALDGQAFPCPIFWGLSPVGDAPAYKNGNGELKSIADIIILSRINSHLNNRRRNSERLLLLSGDKDLIEGVHAWHRQNGEVYVFGVPGSTSHILIKAADKFIPLVETLLKSIDNNKKSMNPKPVAEAEDSRLEQAFQKLAQVLDKMRSDGYKKVPLSRIKSLLADSSGHPFEESRFGFFQFQDFIKAAEGRGLGKLYCNGTTAYILIE